MLTDLSFFHYKLAGEGSKLYLLCIIVDDNLFILVKILGHFQKKLDLRNITNQQFYNKITFSYWNL